MIRSLVAALWLCSFAARAEPPALAVRLERPTSVELTLSGPYSSAVGLGADVTVRRWFTSWLGVEGGLGHMPGNCTSQAAQDNFDVRVGCEYVTARLAVAVAAGTGTVSFFAAAGILGGVAVTHPVRAGGSAYGSDAPIALPTLELGLHLQLRDGLIVRPALVVASGGPIGLSLGYAF